MLQRHKKSGMRPSTLKVPTMTDKRIKRKRKKKRAFKTILTQKIHASVNKEYDWHVYGSVADETH